MKGYYNIKFVMNNNIEEAKLLRDIILSGGSYTKKGLWNFVSGIDKAMFDRIYKAANKAYAW